MSAIAISDEMKTKLEDIARHLNISKEEVIESAISYRDLYSISPDVWLY